MGGGALMKDIRAFIKGAPESSLTPPTMAGGLTEPAVLPSTLILNVQPSELQEIHFCS